MSLLLFVPAFARIIMADVTIKHITVQSIAIDMIIPPVRLKGLINRDNAPPHRWPE
jgi:hypothetical protein